jgi:hypothetical protein
MNVIKIIMLSFLLSGYAHEIKDTETYDGENFQVLPKPPMGPLLDKCSGKILHESCEAKPIVKAKAKKKPKAVVQDVVQPCTECKPIVKEMKIVEEVEIPTYRAHEIVLLGGYGANGLDSDSVDTDGYAQSVTRFYGPVFGLRYTYRVNQEWSGSIEGLTNRTGLFGVGYSFGERR